MKNTECITVLGRALAADLGVCISVSSVSLAKSRLYKCIGENPEFKYISIQTSRTHENQLWLIKDIEDAKRKASAVAPDS